MRMVEQDFIDRVQKQEVENEKLQDVVVVVVV